MSSTRCSDAIARSMEWCRAWIEVLAPVQRDLFDLGALLATPDHAVERQSFEKARDRRRARHGAGARHR